jgi:predicted acyltransferase (DUF342 family)
MALIKQVSTANTFNDWLNTTIEIVDTLNSLGEGGNTSTFFVNTNLQIANNLFVGGNVVVTGNVTLDEIGFNDLSVAGNATINGTLTSSNTTVTNLNVTGNAQQVNVTTSLEVGEELQVYGNLTVFGSTILSGLTSGNVSFTSNTANINIANVNTLIGQANTEIYTYIDNTLSATANANIAKAFLAYSIIFG